MSNYVKIIAVSDLRTDKNNRPFKSITVESSASKEVVDPVTGEIFQAIARPKRTTVQSYEQQYLDDKPHYLFDTPVGSRVYGTIVSRNVEPYDISTPDGEKTVSRYTTFIEATSEDDNFDEIVEKAFKNAGHVILADRIRVNENILQDADQEQEPVTADQEEDIEDEF